MARVARIIGWTVLVLIGLPLLVLAAVLLTANTGYGRHLIESATARLTHGAVQLQGLSGSLPERLRLERLVISDPSGPWLQADQIVLDWSPLKLWGDQIDIQRLTVAQVVASRRPQYPPTPGPHPPLNLPLTIRVNQLSLPRVELAAALAGRAVAMRLDGSGRFRSLQRAALELTVQRLDREPATYQGAATLSPGRVQVSVDVAERAGGPMANLMQLPGLGALLVHLRLDGPTDALGVQLNAQAGALQARASGTVDLPDRSGTLDLSLQAPSMSPRPGLSWQQVLVQAQARGALTAPATFAQVKVEGLLAGSVRLGSLQATLRGEGQGVALDAMAAGLSLPAPLGGLMQAAPIQLRAQAQITGLTGIALDVTLMHPLLTAQAHYDLGSVRLGPRPKGSLGPRAPGQPVNTGTVTATLPNLAPWAALVQLPLEGHATVQGQVDLQSAVREITVGAQLAITGGQAPLSTLLAPRSTVSATLRIDQHGVQLQRAEVSSAQLTASAVGSVEHDRLAITWQAVLPHLAALVSATPGQLSARGHVQGTLPRLSLDAIADSAFSIDGVPGTVRVSVQGSGLPQRLSGSVQASGTLDHAPLALRAAIGRNPSGQLTLRIGEAHWKSAELQGAFSIQNRPFTPVGELSVRVQRLSDLDALLGEPLQGSFTARLGLQRFDGNGRAQLTLQAQQLSLRTVQLQLLQVQGQIDSPLTHPRFALQMSAQGSVHGNATTLAATAAGPLNDLQLRINASTTGATADAAAQGATAAPGAPASAASAAALDNAAQIAAAGNWDVTGGELRLTSLTAAYRRQTARLLAPALLSFRNGLNIDHLRLSVAASTLQIDGELEPRLNLRASLQDVGGAVLGLVLPQLRDLQPRGRAQAQIALRGTLAQPTGTLDFSATGLGSDSSAVRGLPAGAIKLSVQLAADSADIHATLDAGKQMLLSVDGRVPLQSTRPMDLNLTGNMDLNLANAVLEAGGQRVLGVLRVQGQIQGTPAAPQARGQLSLVNASFQDYPRGLQISNINASLTADGSQVQLTHLSAQAGPGTVTASGNINLTAPGMPAELTVTAHNAEALKSDLLTANLDMALKLSGMLRPRQLTASGTLRVNKATINIPNAIPPNVPVLNVIRPGQQPQPQVPSQPLIAVLNLTVNAPTGVFVRGRGLNAEVGGQLGVKGTSSKPNVNGGFDLINGTLDMAGSTLTFTSGRLSFNGSGLHDRIDPTLDFTATTFSGGITATLNVGGYADAPVITLSSMPQLPQDEILARLLFGESVAQLTTLQIAGIGAALVSMSGVGGGHGFNPLTSVQHALGLNRLVISSGTTATAAATSPTGATPGTSSGGATIEAGRYVSNRIYVGAKQSTAGLTQAQVQVDLTHNWKLQTTLSTGGGTIQGATPENDPGSSIGMSYQFEY